MITIQEHLNREDAEDFLDILAKEHWDFLNQRIKTGKRYKENSLIYKCNSYFKECDTPEYLKNYANNSKNEANRHKRFFSYLIADNNKMLRNLIVSKPRELDDIRTELLKILEIRDLYEYDKGKYKQTVFGKLISKTIFSYEAYRKSDFCKKILFKLEINGCTCPYCNIDKMRITEVDINSKGKLKAYLDLDHFYPKAQNPFFALSFFNLIPCCGNCNSRDKGNIPFSIHSHIHPYYESFNDFYIFEITSNFQKKGELYIKNLGKKLNDKTLDDIKLVERYKDGYDEGLELINKYIKYKHKLETADKKFFIELMHEFIPVNKCDILRYERGKMKRDLIKEKDIHNTLDINY